MTTSHSTAARRIDARRAAVSRTAAFTLIELLIVLGIIALLLSILLPTVGRVREMAKLTECMSNMNQLGKAAVAYSMKYDGYLIPGYAQPTVIANGETADAENYASLMINEKLVDAPILETLGSAIQTRASVFRCPSGTDEARWTVFSEAGSQPPMPKDRTAIENFQPIRIKSLRSGKIVDTWYGINACIKDFNTVRIPYRRIPASKSLTDYRLVNMSELKDSARTVFLYDGTFFDLHFNPNRIGARHNDKKITNISFADGHVEAVGTKSLPGGMGPLPTSTDIFSKAALGETPTYIWKTDQK